jgi:hypothetical protein
MKCWPPVLVSVIALLAAAPAFAQVDMATAGPAGTAFTFVGTRAGALAGTFLVRFDISGDVNRRDLLVGAPGSGPAGQGQVFAEVMGPPHTGAVSLSTTDVIFTGENAGDRFGTSIGGGLIAQSTDVAVGAPGAFGGRGAVYVFPGPFAGGGETRSASTDSLLKVIGLPGDQLGAALVAIDVDGDGFRDLVMTAPGSGNVYIVFGGRALGGTVDLSSRPGFVVATTVGVRGTLTLAAADFDADGRFKDLAIGVPDANGGAGAVLFLRGRAFASFPPSFPGAPFSLSGAADGSVIGAAAGDHAGAALQTTDFDGDGKDDLIVGAPGANGPSGSRAGAGAAYVLWGGAQFMTPRSLTAADVTIHGAASGYHLGTAISQGTVRRDLQGDLALLAPGASAKGDIDIVYGGVRSSIAKVIDLAAGVDRFLRADPAGGPLQSLLVLEVSGEGAEDIIAAAPTGTVGANANAGVLYTVLSPTVRPSPETVSTSLPQGPNGTITIQIPNRGSTTTRWAVRSNSPWLSISPTTGTSSAGSPASVTLTVSPGSLAANQTYHGGFSLVSLDRDLVWATTGSVNMTVTPGTPTSTPPSGNSFGVPDPPDEGSVNGVSTPVGTNVSVVPVPDVLVTFASVTSPGRTRVDITRSTQVNGPGVVWGPWVYRITTDAVFSGSVTIGLAYEAPLVAGGQRVIRVLNNGTVLPTQRVETTKRNVLATAPGLPVTVTLTAGECCARLSALTDLDGDGKADLIWRNAQSGDVSEWLMNGRAMKQAGVLLSGVPLAWQIVGTGDFDGDGRGDLMWRNTLTGDVSVWLMSGGGVKQASIVVSRVPLAWQIAGVADLDRDGKADVIWRHLSSGDVSVWLMNGLSLKQSRVAWSGVPLSWQIVGVGDLDGDGMADLTWRHTATGDVSVWLMKGMTVRSASLVWTGVPLTWQIVGIGDLDGDGKSDLLWRHTQSGDVSAWLMNGTTVRQATGVASGVPLAWQVAALGDLDGDRKVDIVWRHVQTGDVSTWLMNGTAAKYAGVSWPGVALAWQIQ